MARHESDREDILREATALVPRAELRVPGECEPVVVGFRRSGAASFYFGGDPVYHFNSAGQLRRAYVGGLLYKADRGRLVESERRRTEEAVVLLSRELAPRDADAFLAAVRERIDRVGQALAAGTPPLRQVPTDADAAGRISEFVRQLPPRLSAARTPRVE